MRRQQSGSKSGGSRGRAASSTAYNPARITELFDSFLLGEPEEDRQVLPQEGIIKFAQSIGIEDPEGDVRVLVLMWKLGAKRRPQQVSREEFEGGLKGLELDTTDKIRKQLLPTLDVDFLQGDDFKSFYRFAFLFSLEGTRRNIEKDMIVELLPMVIGQRSEYTNIFIDFLNATKKPEEMITADQWNQFYDFSLAYPTVESVTNGYEDDASWPILLDEFVDFIKEKCSGERNGTPAGKGGGRKK